MGEFQTAMCFLKRLQGTKMKVNFSMQTKRNTQRPVHCCASQCRKSAGSPQTSAWQTRKSHNLMKECAGGRYNKPWWKTQLQDLPRHTGHPGWRWAGAKEGATWFGNTEQNVFSHWEQEWDSLTSPEAIQLCLSLEMGWVGWGRWQLITV